MGIKNIKEVLPDYMISIISTLQHDHHFFAKDYVKPIKQKKKPAVPEEVLNNSDNFWTGIPDERKPSKTCRIFIKPKDIEHLPVDQMSKAIKKHETRLQ